MELRHLRYFLAVAETSHFRRAAENLHIAQPTLSQQIGQLEKELGTALFDRIARRVQLTTAGETFRIHARRVLHEVEEAQAALGELEGLEAGRLCLGVVQTVSSRMIPPAVSRFAKAHPGVMLHIEDLSADEIEDELVQGRLHLGISFLPPDADELQGELLCDEELVLIVAPDHRLARRARLPLRELDGERLVLQSESFAPRRLFEECARSVGIRPKVCVEMNSIEGILATVRDLGGATVLPSMAIRKDKESEFRLTTLTDPTPHRKIGVLWRRGSYRSRAANRFVEHIVAVVRDPAFRK
jgi:LysR family transcriptional regulator, cyn operon transcriptional activator